MEMEMEMEMDHRAIEIDEMEDQAIEMAAHSVSTDGSMAENDFQHRPTAAVPPNGYGPTSFPWKPSVEPGAPSTSGGGNPVLTQEEQTDREQSLAQRRPDTEMISLSRIQHRLDERRVRPKAGGGGGGPYCSIFRLPPALCGINRKAEQPEVVSIGPYHRGKDHLLNFEEHKWFFLEKLLARRHATLEAYLRRVALMENAARDCYSEPILMSSGDFIEMMLLDGCFVAELLRHLGRREELDDETHDPIFSQPWLIPILIRDLLKLENQLPFFVIESLFVISCTGEERKGNFLSVLALQVFDLAFPRPKQIIDSFSNLRGKHLLHLFHSSLVPSSSIDRNYLENYRPCYQSVHPITQLRPSGIKFRSFNATSFLDINFQNRVLEIPSITINDFTTTVLINCIAFEQCQEEGSKYLTDYASFMNCLINQPRDVAFLCSDGIITRFSQDDQYVASLFNKLGKNMVFNVHDCYLSKQFREVDSYYNSNWATMMRTYFCSPWSLISVCSAFVIIFLTAVQTVFSILSFIWH